MSKNNNMILDLWALMHNVGQIMSYGGLKSLWPETITLEKSQGGFLQPEDTTSDCGLCKITFWYVIMLYLGVVCRCLQKNPL